jgi:hypothetical protein
MKRYVIVSFLVLGCSDGVGFDSDCTLVEATGTSRDCGLIEYPPSDALPVRFDVGYIGVANGDGADPFGGDYVPFDAVTATVPEDSACTLASSECLAGTCYLSFDQVDYGVCRVRMQFESSKGRHSTCFVQPVARDEAEYARLDAEPYRCD